MATHRDAVLAFGLLLACAASVMAAIGWQAFIGFVLGVTTAPMGIRMPDTGKMPSRHAP